VIRAQILTNLFKSAHPRNSQVAVLKHNPVTRYKSALNKLGCLFSLTLTKRHWFNMLLPGLSEFNEEIERIRTRREHENERSCTC